MTNVSRTLSRAGLTLKKHSPEILIGLGIVGTITSTVMACKASTKASEILENTKNDLAKVREVANNPEYADTYTEKDYKKDLTIVYTKTGLELVKLYAPAVLLGTASIASILTGHGVLRKRFVELSAAYTAVDTAFKEYRGRVVDRFGKDLDRELKYNIKNNEIKNEENKPEKITINNIIGTTFIVSFPQEIDEK